MLTKDMDQPTVTEDLVLQSTAYLTGWRSLPDELKV
jgi:hypothetical protein